MTRRERKSLERSLPVGKVARAAVAGATVMKIGAQKLGLLSKRPFLSSTAFQQHQAESDDEIAETLFQGLSKLRGSALKVAQMMSLELGLLPDVYRKELYKSHYQVPPLNRAVVRRVITGELGKPPEEIFDEFDPVAFAAASLGQVHKARARAGDLLAVKVQYPGVGVALKNDLQLVKRLALPFVRSEYVVNTVQELERRLTEEVDYEREAQATASFHDQGRACGVLVPRVFEEYSSAAVLTTEFVDGVHLDRWLQTHPSQERRDQVAQTIYDFFVRSFVEYHRIHSDPNPGNYLFRDDGSVALIDFGSVKAFAPELCARVLKSWRAIIRGDAEEIVTHYSSLGIGRGDRRLVERDYHSVLAPIDQWMGQPYQSDVFDFGKHPDYCTRGAALYRNIVLGAPLGAGGWSGFAALRSHDVVNGFTTETVLFDRNLYGLYRLFTELKARVRMNHPLIFD